MKTHYNTQAFASVRKEDSRYIRKEIHYCQNYAEENTRMKVTHNFQFVFLLVCCCCFASLHDPKQPQQFPSPTLPMPARVSRSIANTTDLSGTAQDPITSRKMSPDGVGTPGVSLQHGACHQTGMSHCAPEAESHWCLQTPLKRCWHTLVSQKTHHRISLLLFYLLISNIYVCIHICTHIYITLVTYLYIIL